MEFSFFFFVTLIVFAVSGSEANTFRCDKSEYSLFILPESISAAKQAVSKESAAEFCLAVGHRLPERYDCYKELFTGKSAASETLPNKLFWINKPSGCYAMKKGDQSETALDCSVDTAHIICEGISIATWKDETSEGQKLTGKPGLTMAGLEIYYVFCGVLGILLIFIVTAAAIWRSGYINNRYSRNFRPLQPESVPKKKAAALSSSESRNPDLPSSYIKASETRETLGSLRL